MEHELGPCANGTCECVFTTVLWQGLLDFGPPSVRPSVCRVRTFRGSVFAEVDRHDSGCYTAATLSEASQMYGAMSRDMHQCQDEFLKLLDNLKSKQTM